MSDLGTKIRYERGVRINAGNKQPVVQVNIHSQHGANGYKAELLGVGDDYLQIRTALDGTVMFINIAYVESVYFVD
jgi:urease gamma subunit